jgi:N-dimethylarginine dimethylaminohydrolase
MPTPINTTVLMSGADYFADQQAINAYMDKHVSIDRQKAQAEHTAIREALQNAGVKVVQVEPPADCQDGVYTANWALVRGDKAVLSTLPNARKGEEAYAAQILTDLGKTVYKVPDGVHFSGQGDALPCGNYLFAGTGYRTEAAAHQFVADTLGYEVISLQAVPKRGFFGHGRPVINKDSGWPDSYFYDLDLALAVLKYPTETTQGLIAWCPDAFLPGSQAKVRALTNIDKIEVSFEEAKLAFACNLISTGQVVVMSSTAPQLKAAIEAHGLKVVTPVITELAKGGGYIRCTTLTLDNI